MFFISVNKSSHILSIIYLRTHFPLVMLFYLYPTHILIFFLYDCLIQLKPTSKNIDHAQQNRNQRTGNSSGYSGGHKTSSSHRISNSKFFIPNTSQNSAPNFESSPSSVYQSQEVQKGTLCLLDDSPPQISSSSSSYDLSPDYPSPPVPPPRNNKIISYSPSPSSSSYNIKHVLNSSVLLNHDKLASVGSSNRNISASNHQTNPMLSSSQVI